MLSLLFFVAGFRYETGIDWLQYTTNFNQLKSFKDINVSNIFSRTEVGFFMLSTLIKSLGFDVQCLFVVMQLLISFFLWKTLKYFTDYKLLALLIYFSLLFFHLDMNLMRQALAVSIFFYSLKYIAQKNLIKYILFIFFGFLFHWSIIIFLPLYFFINKRYSTVLLSLLVVCFVLFYILHLKTGNLIYNLSDLFFGKNSNITYKVSYYTSNSLFSINRIFSVGSILNIVIIIFTLTFRKKLEIVMPNFNLFLNLMIIQLFFYFVLYEYIEFSGRLRFYTLIAYILILPYFIKVFNPLVDRIIVYFVIVLYCFSYANIYLIGNNQQTISYHPYQNYIVYKLTNKKSDGKERLNKYYYHFRKERKEMRKK
jgi:hypothetical protein